MEIIGRANSSNVQKVLWCCAELGLEYTRKDAGREFGVVDTPEFLELNPNRKVPVLVDGNDVLWESNSIVRLLSAQYGQDTLYPAELQIRASADRWMDWQLATLGPGFTEMFHGLVRDKAENRDWVKINKSIKITEGNLSILDQQLAKTNYVSGITFTMGDIPVGIYAYRWYTFENLDRKPLPNLEKWYGLLKERPAFRNFVMVGLG